jgi:hypothetical protein
MMRQINSSFIVLPLKGVYLYGLTIAHRIINTMKMTKKKSILLCLISLVWSSCSDKPAYIGTYIISIIYSNQEKKRIPTLNFRVKLNLIVKFNQAL